MTNPLEQMLLDRAREEKEREYQKEIRWANFWDGVVDFSPVFFMALFIGGVIWFAMAMTEHDDKVAHKDHVTSVLNSDFKDWCVSLHGDPHTDGKNLCLAADGTILMQEGPGDSSSEKHYDAEFTKYCQARGGSPVLDDKDLCIKTANGVKKILMVGSKKSGYD